MANNIDKSLPNQVTNSVAVESPEETFVDGIEQMEEVNSEGVEIVKNEDGSANYRTF